MPAAAPPDTFRAHSATRATLPLDSVISALIFATAQAQDFWAGRRHGRFQPTTSFLTVLRRPPSAMQLYPILLTSQQQLLLSVLPPRHPQPQHHPPLPLDSFLPHFARRHHRAHR
ncbi:hypothetical protein BDZ89DRAFT_1151978 [Hymenopellis radicata]|nr:hypothetical protein BDZ89DRAFT_1151978 [Hymenopellis radicata]